LILSPEVLTLLILDFLFVLFTSIVFVISLQIWKSWDLNSTLASQYTLEKRSFLASTIIKFIFVIKIPLFLFFIFTLDKISNVLTGAMCGAGVLDATDVGNYLIMLKVINIYLFAFWLVLNNSDLQNPTQPYTKLKFALFSFIYILLIFEIYLEVDMFFSFEIEKLVSCCGSLYSSSSDSLISALFHVDNSLLVSLFYVNYLFLVIFYFFKNNYFFALSNTLFVINSVFSLIMFFGTYIYELPSHHCPFCFLQTDYYFVGYFLYGALFMGTFNGLVVIFKNELKYYKISMLFNSLYLVVVSLYVGVYYIRNGVLLSPM